MTAIAALALLAAGAYADHASGAASPAVPRPRAPSCPLAHFDGVKATVTNTPEGVAVRFTAPPESVDTLRRTVRSMSEAGGQRGDIFVGCPCAMATEEVSNAASLAYGGGWPSLEPYASHEASRASLVDETSDGAVLRLVAKDTSKLRLLRDSVKQNVESVHDAIKNGCVRH